MNFREVVAILNNNDDHSARLWMMKVIGNAVIGIIILMTLQFSQTSIAATPIGKVMLVLDASGSMWGKVEGQEKILIAREVVGDMLDNWDQSLDLGLVAYGHRQKGDCSDIETLVPAGGEISQIRSTVNQLKPKGKTPLSAAVKHAAEHLRYSEEKAMVILLSDGKETCDLDPCEVGRSLEQLGVDFTAHVIGFDINIEDRAGLACLASETGGQYFDAQNSNELQGALEQAVEQVKRQPDTVIATLGTKGREYTNNGLQWLATTPGGETITATGAVFSLPLEQGIYQVSATAGTFNGEAQIEVEAGESQTHQLILNAGDLAVSATVEVAGEIITNPQVEWSVTRQADALEIVRELGERADLVLAAGRYHIVASYQQQIQSTDIEIAAGGTAEAALVFTIQAASLEAPESALASSLVDIRWDGPGGEADYITVTRTDDEDTKYGKYVYVENGNPVKLLMPDTEGMYELRYVKSGGNKVLARRGISIQPVKTSLMAVEAGPISSEVAVTWEGPNAKGDYITLVQPDAEEGKYDKYFYTEKANPGKLQLPDTAGEYELRYVSRQSNRVLARRLIEATEVAVEIIAQDRSNISEEISIQWQGPGGKGDFITVVALDAEEGRYGKYTYTTSGNPLKLIMPDQSGTYELRYQSGGSKNTLARKIIEVQDIQVTLDAPERAAMGSSIEVSWQGPDGKGDYITVINADADDIKYGKYAYTKGGPRLKLQMPDQPGQYEIRYRSGQSKNVLARRVIEIEVVNTTISVPDSISISQVVEIAWTGPDGKNDFITVIAPDAPPAKYGKYAYTKKGSPAELIMPDVPGQYEVRYVSSQSNLVLARQLIEVADISVSLRAPDEAAIGSNISIDWSGPNGRNDFITIVEATSEDHARGKVFYTKKSTPAILQMPDTPGLYELRYFSSQSRKVLSRRPINVTDVAVMVDSLVIAKIEQDLRVEWQGPAGSKDIIAVANINDPDKSWIQHTVARDSPLKLKMPKTAGTYELRYVTGQDKRVLTRRLVQVMEQEQYLNTLSSSADGELQLNVSQGGKVVTQGLSWQIYAVEGNTGNIISSTESTPRVALSMGIYRVNLSSSQGAASVDVTVNPGQVLRKTIELP